MNIKRFFRKIGLKKYLTIVSFFWQRALTYRFTVLAYRVGEITESVILIILWWAIYLDQTLIRNYTLSEMVTYILLGNLFYVLVRNFLADVIARDIREGKLSLYLIKPMSYFRYVLVKEIGRISLATILSFGTQLLVLIAFSSFFVFNFDIARFLVIFLMLILAFITELLISFLIGLVAFWTDEVEGIYATLDRIRKFLSGGYFPLSILPAYLVNVSLLLPFSYNFFIPTQVYLKKIDLIMGLQGLLVQILWIFILYGIIKLIWKRGLVRYEAYGG